jgi:hypothetical protein
MAQTPEIRIEQPAKPAGADVIAYLCSAALARHLREFLLITACASVIVPHERKMRMKGSPFPAFF